ncbi:MAG: Uma2 family endonuclease [Fimbriiglobus sp.]
MPDEEIPEPYLIRGEQRYRIVPSWDVRLQAFAMKVATMLDRWQNTLAEPRFEVLNNAGFQFRIHPPTLVRIPAAVVEGLYPTLESDWVPGLPLVVIEVVAGPEQFGYLWERVEEYKQCGVPVIWVLTPGDDSVSVFRPGHVGAVECYSGNAILTGDPELPGFTARVADYFR